MSEDMYTRLFVRTSMEHGALLAFVAGLVGGTVDRRTVVCGPYQIDVRPNDDADKERIKTDPDDFIYFPYAIEVVAPRDHSLDGYLSIASRLMEAIAAEGGGVVAASDWEDRLPGKGKLGVGLS